MFSPDRKFYCVRLVDSGRDLCRLYAESAIGIAETLKEPVVDGWRNVCALSLCRTVGTGVASRSAASHGIRLPGDQQPIRAVLPIGRDYANPLYIFTGLHVFAAQLRSWYGLFENGSDPGCFPGPDPAR